MTARRAPCSPTRSAIMLAVAMAAIFPATAPSAQPAPETPPRSLAEVPVFQMPDLARRHAATAERAGAGDMLGAEGELRGALARHPGLHELHFGIAQLQAARGNADGAAASLLRAAEAGRRDWFGAAARLPVFASLRGREDFAEALAALAGDPPDPPLRARPPAVPAPILDGVALVDETNAEWSETEGAVRAAFTPLPPAPAVPGPVMTGSGEPAHTLNRLHAGGRAAGNHGDFYENRDEGHSNLDLRRFPQITRLAHGPASTGAGFHRALAQGLAISLGPQEFPPVFGNASVAMTAEPFWRSMARLALTEPGRARELARQWRANQIYVHPEHRDHDAFFGDVFPAAQPYIIVSQGSSGSDRTALEAIALILAALPPETKARAVDERLIAPTVQMIWRRGQKGIETDADYLGSAAHPSAFPPEAAEPARMLDLAQSLRPEDLPPAVTLRVLDESRAVPGVTLFGDGLSERLFDTSAAIARIHRGAERTYRLTVSAGGTRDPNGRPLAFRWVLLRGDPDKVRITPLGEAGEAASLEIDWDETTRSPEGLRSHRVDIGIFADNGAHLSAPAFVSVAFPPRQRRSYDAAGRIEMVDHDSVARQAEYADPWLFPERLWRDVFHWDADGRLRGWTRTGEGAGPDRFARFTRHGAEVRTEDAEGRPLLAERIAHPVGRGPDGRSRVFPTATGAFLAYDYAGPDDRLGTARAVAPPQSGDAPDAPAPSAIGTRP